MREWTGKLDLEARDVADGETEHSPERHHAPEPEVSEAAEAGETAQLSKTNEQREEQEGGIDVVVVGQFPDVSVHCWHHLLGVDGVQRDKGTGQNPKKDTGPGEGPRNAFLVHAKPEST